VTLLTHLGKLPETCYLSLTRKTCNPKEKFLPV
jgi:hypothetical protein